MGEIDELNIVSKIEFKIYPLWLDNFEIINQSIIKFEID